MNCTTCTTALTAHQAGRYTCHRCTTRMAQWLRELPHQLVVLRASSMRETGAPTAGRSATRTAPIPGRADVLNLLGPAAPAGPLAGPDQVGQPPVQETLYRCVSRIRAARGLTGPEHSTPEALAAWLLPHLEWCAEQHWAADMYTELEAMMRAIRSITRVTPRTRPVPQPCPACDALALAEEDWQEHTWCRVCGARFTREDLALGAAAWAERQKAA